MCLLERLSGYVMGMVIPLVSSNLCDLTRFPQRTVVSSCVFSSPLWKKPLMLLLLAERQIIQKYICQHWGKNDKIILSYKRFLAVAVKRNVYLFIF